MLTTKHLFKTALTVAALAASSLVHADINVGQSVATSGPDAPTGKAIALGASIYFSHVNADGGIGGQEIKLTTLDDGGEPARTVSNTLDLVNKNDVVALVGYQNGDAVRKLLDGKTLENAGVPLVGVDSGAENIRKPGSPYLFHLRAGYNQEIEKLVALLNGKLGMRKFGVLAQKDGVGDANVATLKAELAKRKLQLVGEGYFDKTANDTQTAANALYKVQPEAVILMVPSAPAATFIKQFKSLGGTAQLYGLSQIQSSEVVRLAGASSASGLGISQVFPSPGSYSGKLIREFQNDAKPYLNQGVPEYALLEGYVAAHVLADALRQAGKRPTRPLVYKALSNMQKVDLGGYVLDFSDSRIGSRFVDMTMISPTGALAR
ncbi:ABC transporter substrate-binding protein [Amantichitinum ursilacus]|uniref:Receptor family ligand binding region n=1 Tax=Amantichitinum ursilacus TaxID=857265 RepID=A0A0N0GL45_9NEIS|nr:ABC transporter substrate-binding protein [Amantichitinum ursilacus]KPC49557.1 Receptor family ligand binding region [Amantichitinum ursilacus]